MQSEIIQMINDGHNLIITGYPGTGKSHILARIIDYCQLKGKKVRGTASTGKSAVVLTEALDKIKSQHTCVTIHKYFGILDGRLGNDEVVELMISDERYEKKRKELLDIYVIVMDEISMVSQKIFEQVEHVCRAVKNNNKLFGGIQIVLCGDFYQLPPVPSPQYGDDGSYIFSSCLIHCFHHVNLTTVYRQRDEDLSRAIREVARGQIENDSILLLKRLSRTLPPGEPPLFLYATNLDVDIHNANCLMNMEGEDVVYRCVDEGDTIGLKAKKELHLQKGCPVLLLVNMSDYLVNGLTGKVTKLEPDRVHIYFPSLKRTEVITRYLFTKYSTTLKKDIGSRSQIPVQLAFAITVHKSQGMTLQRVSVDCRNVRQYGQLTVALSRAKYKKDLQIKNFSVGLLQKPPQCIDEFYKRPALKIDEDLKCCVSSEIQLPSVIQGIPTTSQPGGSDYDADDDIVTDDDDEELLNVLHNIDSVLKCTDAKQLPDDIDVEAILDELQIATPKTEQQKEENEAVKLLTKSLNQTKMFVSYLWQTICELSDKHMPSPSLHNKDIHAFYKAYNALVCSDQHRLKVKYLLGQNPSPAHDNVLFRISTKLRNHVIKKKEEPLLQDLRKEAEQQQGTYFEESGEGRAKIRYIAGWCISSLLKKYRRSISLSLYNKKKIKETEKNIGMKRLLEHLQADDNEVCEDLESLQDISRKQNIRKGLYVVSDTAFSFFQLLDRRVRSLQSSANFRLYSTDFGNFLKSSLENDLNLETQWSNLFVEFETVATDVNILYHEVISKYVLMSLSQFRKEYADEKNTTKKEATRKQIKMRKESKILTQFTFKTIQADKTKKKEASHKRLQSEVLSNNNFLNKTFSKKELILLCQAYGTQNYKNLKTKKCVQEHLNMTIANASGFQNTCIFDDDPDTAVMSGPSENPSVLDLTSVSDVPSSSDVQSSSNPDSECKRKRRNVRKGKGKSSTKRRKSMWPCGICGRDASFDSVGCDGCDKWYHGVCLKIDNLDELPEEWFCQECLNN